jgi:polyisoprenoid-binding protein YceI
MKLLAAGVSLALLASIAACSPASEPAPAAETPAPAAAPVPVAIAAPAGEYIADPTHSSITWQLKHLGLSDYTAKFKTFDATVTLDPANIANSKVVATVKASDVAANYAGDYKAGHPQSRFASWDDDLANSTNFLNGGEFPVITFASTGVEVTGERTAKVTGDLTLLGVTKPITLDVTFGGETDSHPFTKAPALGFSATGTFKRSDFGSTAMQGMIGDDITVIIESDFVQKPAAQ